MQANLVRVDQPELTISTASNIDLTAICQTFPLLPPGELIARDNYLDTIDSILESDVQAILLEGPSGIGKTTLAAMYALRHRTSTISLFVRSSNRWGYDPDVLRQDLCSQLHWVVFGTELPSSVASDDVAFRELMFAFRRQLRRANTLYRFVLDGLNEIPIKHGANKQIILDLLPFDFDHCRFIFTTVPGEQIALPNSLRSKTYPLTPFGLDETRRYIESVVSPAAAIEEIHALSKGMPGYLASVRRSIKSGQTSEDFIKQVKQSTISSFENEWRAVDPDNNIQILALAILAYDEGIHSVLQMSTLMSVDTNQILAALQGLSFIEIDSAGTITFTSDAYRSFAATKLTLVKKEAQDLVVDEMIARANDPAVIDLLPQRLREAGKFKELLDFLSPQYLVNTLARDQSLAPVRRKVEIGVEAAIELNRDADLLRLTMQKSALADSYAVDLCRVEIQARVALGDYQSSIAIANAVALKEDRLHLLAVVAKSIRLQRKAPDQSLVDQIHALYRQIDPQILAEHSDQLAGDLIFAAPELALSLMSQGKVDQTKADRTFRGFGIDSESKMTQEESDGLDAVRKEVKDPRLKEFLSGASLLVGNLSASDVLTHVHKFAKATDRIFFLRQWCVRNRRDSRAGEISLEALRLIIKTTEYTPNARDIRQISMPLPFITDDAVAAELLKSLDAQRGSVEKYGPTIDYVRLQCLMAEAEIKRDHKRARDRIVEIYYYICGQVVDISTKVEAFAYVLSALARIDVNGELEKEEQIRSATESELESGLSTLFASTAEQLRICRGAIEALSVSRIDLAIALAERLNHEPRRDRAFLAIVEAVVASRRPEMELNELPRVLERVRDARLQDEGLQIILSKMGEGETLASIGYTDAAQFLSLVRRVRDPYERCRAVAAIYRVIKLDPASPTGLIEQLNSEMDMAWRSIDATTGRVAAGFGIAADFATHSPEVARDYLARAESEKCDMVRQSPGATNSFLAALGIAVTAFSGLLPQNLETDADFDRLAELIKQLPSDEQQCQIWADVAERLYSNRRTDRANEIVVKFVRPLLDRFTGDRAGRRPDVVLTAAPALYKQSPIAAKNEIASLAPNERDEALQEICAFILRKKANSEPMETPRGFEFDVRYEEILDLLDLAKLMEMDNIIYSIVEAIGNSMSASKHKNRFTQSQRDEVAQQIEDLGKSKFPNPRFIKHDGYVIVMRAQALRIRRATGKPWDDLVKSARAIPNAADRTFVVGLIAEMMSTKDLLKHPQLLAEVKTTLASIPSAYDRVERSQTLAQTLWKVNQPFARELCREAISSVKAIESPDLVRAQRGVVDFAHRMDPEFATSLVSKLDDDGARVATRAALEDRVKLLEVKRSMLNAKATAQSSNNVAHTAAECAKAAWMTLATLNADKSEALRLEQLRSYVRLAGTLPLPEAYPIIAYSITSACVRYGNGDQARTVLRPLFEASLLACQLAARMTARASGVLEGPLVTLLSSKASKTACFIRAGERPKALGYLRDWLENNVKDYLKICDPYFGLEDLEALRLVLAACPTVKVQILTSVFHLKDRKVPLPYNESFQNAWKAIVDQEAPETEIVAAGLRGSGNPPIHDRFWLTRGAGLRIGTSFKSLGEGKDSEISVLSETDAATAEIEIDKYLNRIEKEHLGVKLEYQLFNL